ncbi:uncharacterized protein C6orf203 [Scaptodrosophila lebanonensis]|uniref:Uncharacterized protein C6orf203 n=1 Tax=Drosophila lebanonensis TaxID=7225 RepID=A0A6J2T6G7_DROLE|nr:uncharacterized protein C6orf203 [Scaptodrosophila lebanonensis]
MLRNLQRIKALRALAPAAEKTQYPTTTATNILRLQFPTTTTGQQYGNLYTSRILHKYDKKSSRATEHIDSDDDDDEDFKDERDSKVVKAKVNSLRADLLVKSGLGMARNKVELVFYESKIRVNGKKLQKKSVQLNVGDEIDVIRGFSQTNPSHLVVSRVVILAANEHDEGLSVQLRRYKALLIDNYSGSNAYKSSEPTVH